jgi:hypothetical protein
MALRFKAKIKINGINPYVLVSRVQAQQLQPNWRKPMPVMIQVNGKPDEPWHINMMPVGDGSFYLYLHGDVRKASKTEVGDSVEIDVKFDNAYRNGPMNSMPDWFNVPLRANKTALNNWNNLTPSRQKEILRYLASLKSNEARQGNLDKVMRMLSGESGRYMARDWKNGK